MKKKSRRKRIPMGIKGIALLFVFVAGSSCTKKRSLEAGEIPVTEYEFKREGLLKNWQCFDIKTDQVCIPGNWEYIPDPDPNHYFFSRLQVEDYGNNYFVVLKYDASQINNDLKAHLGDVLRQVKADTHEIAKEWKITRLSYEKMGQCYYGEFLTEIDGKQYYAYMMYVIRSGYFLDFALKTRISNKDEMYKMFKRVVLNYKLKSEFIFGEDDPLVSVKFMDSKDFE